MSQVIFKIFQGTRSLNAPRLCDSCHSGLVTRGATSTEETVYCDWAERTIGIRVTECNRYSDRALPSLYEMRKIAWVLETSVSRHGIGFVPARQWRKNNDEDDLIPGRPG